MAFEALRCRAREARIEERRAEMPQYAIRQICACALTATAGRFTRYAERRCRGPRRQHATVVIASLLLLYHAILVRRDSAA